MTITLADWELTQAGASQTRNFIVKVDGVDTEASILVSIAFNGDGTVVESWTHQVTPNTNIVMTESGPVTEVLETPYHQFYPVTRLALELGVLQTVINDDAVFLNWDSNGDRLAFYTTNQTRLEELINTPV